NIDFISFSLILSIAALMTLLPVSISGIGTRDVALVVLLKPFGISAEEAVAFSLSILAIFMIDIAIGFLFSLSNPIKKENNGSI
ncbi:MAG: flippase-like domain-containing protein, partial [Candidatus Marinimicrobia bacterium]|nr:flippase-like domain-containing protein [Candidatus Neomarinimicrobiota bacterium]